MEVLAHIGTQMALETEGPLGSGEKYMVNHFELSYSKYKACTPTAVVAPLGRDEVGAWVEQLARDFVLTDRLAGEDHYIGKCLLVAGRSEVYKPSSQAPEKELDPVIHGAAVQKSTVAEEDEESPMPSLCCSPWDDKDADRQPTASAGEEAERNIFAPVPSSSEGGESVDCGSEDPAAQAWTP